MVSAMRVIMLHAAGAFKHHLPSSQPSRSGRETPDEEDLIPLPQGRELQQRNLPTVRRLYQTEEQLEEIATPFAFHESANRASDFRTQWNISHMHGQALKGTRLNNVAVEPVLVSLKVEFV